LAKENVATGVEEMKKRILMMSVQDSKDEFEVFVHGTKKSWEGRKYQVIVYLRKEDDVSDIVRREVDSPSDALAFLAGFKGQEFDATVSRRLNDAPHDTQVILRIRKDKDGGTITMTGVNFL
jgi:hypothetical protein